MGNLYTDNLIGTVIGLSVADDWEGARREWRIVGCEVDETHSATCVCGKEGLRYANGYDKENPKIPDWYWNVWDDYDCWSNSLNGNEITYRFLRKRGCPAYLAKTIASK